MDVNKKACKEIASDIGDEEDAIKAYGILLTENNRRYASVMGTQGGVEDEILHQATENIVSSIRDDESKHKRMLEGLHILFGCRV